MKLLTSLLITGMLTGLFLSAQTPPAPAKPKQRPPAFPQRPAADPVVLERGKALYDINCTFCHGIDARGGSGGPNLIRASLVLNDQDGELIGPVLREGREGMPKFPFSASQISDVSAYIHSFRVGGYDISRMTPETIVVGNAQAGQAYFAKTCTGCHSATGNLKGLATRITDPKILQQTWLMPGSGSGRPGPSATPVPPTTVTVTTASAKVNGRLVRIDDFYVSLIDAEGTPRSFTREGDSPKVELHDPLIGHRKLFPEYTDKDIHDVTAYLVTLK